MRNFSRKVHRYLISFEYKGNFFSGFQKQCAQNQPKSTTVQGTIESALSLYTNGKAEKIFGSSRTDAGVHATGQSANFYSYLYLNKEKRFKILKSLNFFLQKKNITILSIQTKKKNFRALEAPPASQCLRGPEKLAICFLDLSAS